MRLTKIKVVKRAGVKDIRPLIEIAGALEIWIEAVLTIRTIKKDKEGKDQKDEKRAIIDAKVLQKIIGLIKYRELHAGSKDEKMSININKI